MLNVGVVGCGGIATSRHLPSWRAMHAKIVAVADSNQARATTAADRYGAVAYQTLADLLRNPQVSVVDICTPIELHAEQVIQSLDAGKEVIVEKPMAVSADECKRMIQAAKKNNCRLFVAHTFRYYPAIKRLHEWIGDNKLGETRLLSSIVGNDADPRHPLWKRALWEFGLHRIDLVRHLLGEITYVDADFLEQKCLLIKLGTSNGAAVLTIVDGKVGEEILVCGTTADAWIPSLALDVAILNRYGVASYNIETIKTNLRRSTHFGYSLAHSSIRHALLGVKATAHYSCLHDFAEALVTKKNSALVSADDGLAAVKCLETIDSIIQRKEGVSKPS